MKLEEYVLDELSLTIWKEGMPLRKAIENKLGKGVSIAKFYVTMSRMEDEGSVESREKVLSNADIAKRFSITEEEAAQSGLSRGKREYKMTKGGHKLKIDIERQIAESEKGVGDVVTI